MQNDLTEHPHHWYKDATHFFQVENTLYRLHPQHLSMGSVVLRDMFFVGGVPANPGVNDGSSVEKDGLSVDKAIFLPQVSIAAFDIFVTMTYGRFPQPPYPPNVLAALLRFSDQYQAQAAEEFALYHIYERRFHFHGADLIQISYNYKRRNFFEAGFKNLLDTSARSLTEDHKSAMGYLVYAAISECREALEKHRRIVAFEPPPVTAHANGCLDQSQCETDWITLWLNVMPRFLLDGRNRLSYEQAVQRLSDQQFGEMGEGCRIAMLEVVKGGKAFNLVNNFIWERMSSLADSIFVTVPTPNI